MKEIKYIAALFALLAGFMPYQVVAAPVCWNENGHCYERIDEPFLSWFESRDMAKSMSYHGIAGHLATITSQEENEFITNSFRSSVPILLDAAHFWLGAFQPAGSPEPEGNWQWITGEPFIYTNWNAGEPNNVGSNDKNALEIYLYQAFRLGSWNDDLPRINNYVAGFIVEYPTHKREYIDLSELPDINGNSIPESAALRRLENGHPQVVIKDGNAGKAINFVAFFGPGWEPRGVDSVDANGDNMPDLAVLAVRETDEKIKVEVRDARTDALIKRVEFFSPKWEARNLTVGDADYNGMPDISVLAVNKTNGNVAVEIRDAATGNKIRRVWFPK